MKSYFYFAKGVCVCDWRKIAIRKRERESEKFLFEILVEIYFFVDVPRQKEEKK